MADLNQPSSSSQNDSSGRTEGKRTIEQGVEYLKLVRDTFGSRNDSRYRGFLRVMKDYKKGEIDTLKVISLVKLMFEGHHELLMGFNILLPRGYNIDSVAPIKDPQTNVEVFAPVIELVNKIQMRLQDHKKYMTFLDLIHRFSENRNMNIFKELSIIFEGYPDLLAEFYFLYPEAREVLERCTEDSET